jgi:hypothetical protein
MMSQEEEMKAFRSFMALGMLLAAAAPALAQSPGPAYVMIIHPDGMSTIGQITREASQTVIAHSKQLSQPVIVILSAGKAYLGDEPAAKMPDGSTMMEFIHGSFCSDARHAGGCS